MKAMNEHEKYFIINEFEDGWGMEDITCEEQLFDYCIEALFIPEEKIKELNIYNSFSLEIILNELDIEDISEDWYINLIKISKE